MAGLNGQIPNVTNGIRAPGWIALLLRRKETKSIALMRKNKESLFW